MTYEEKLTEIRSEGKELYKAMRNEVKAFGQMHDSALEDKVLSKKTKELIALGIAVNLRCEPCIVSHTEGLVSLGASREEIVEALSVSLFMGGGPAKMYAGKALACFDELVEKVK